MIAITSKGSNMSSQVDSRFGRCEYVIFYEEDTQNFTAEKNPSRDASGGAGVSTAQYLADNNVKVLITGNVGPKAIRALNAAGIEIYVGASGTVTEGIEAYKNNELTNTNEATTK